MEASDEVRNAHHRALGWAHVLDCQVSELYAARAKFLAAFELVTEKRVYATEDQWPYFEMDAKAHFVLVAAKQLLRSLNAFDGDDRLPASMPAATVSLVRNALEHWDEPGGPSGREMTARGVDARDHRWSLEGSGLLGQLVPDAVLQAWARAVYEELRAWDPW